MSSNDEFAGLRSHLVAQGLGRATGGIQGAIDAKAWETAKYWTWVETVAWLATRDDRLMAELKRLERGLREGHSARSVRNQLRDVLGGRLEAKSYERHCNTLFTKLEDGSLSSIDATSLKPIPPGIWGNFPRAFMTGAKILGGGPPGILIKRTEVLSIWPRSTKPPRGRGRGRRQGVGGYAARDILLAHEMNELMTNGTATSLYNAATIVAPRAMGSNEPGVREKRLCKRYKEIFPISSTDKIGEKQT